MGNKILFVDDDPNIQKMVELFLRGEGFKITFAKNGRSALKFFERDTFDLVMTDIQMPEMDGLSLTREVRKTNTQIPIIVVSAFGQEKIAVENLPQNTTILNKPFERDILIEIINSKIKF
jgi:DNA-binding response OmpR family regulator